MSECEFMLNFISAFG